MKKRILSILLALCMVLMLCPVTAFAEDSYSTLTWNFQYGTLIYNDVEQKTSPYVYRAPRGDAIALPWVENCSPYEFVGWKEAGSGTVYKPDAEFVVDDSEYTFNAVYQVQGSLAVTVNGFEVGNTPADCTYTFESTIPGVTFSEDDIQYIGWHKYAADGDLYPMNNTDVFRVDTRYRCVIQLDNNGLTEVPAVTVNGKTPDYCSIATSNGVPTQLQIQSILGTPAEPPSVLIGDVNLDGEVTVTDATMLQDCLENPESFEKLTSKQRKAADYNEDDEVNYKDLIALRSFLKLITINGPDVVCAQQDYEFTVTPPAGVTLDTQFGYNTGSSSDGTDWSRSEGGVYYGTVPASGYGGAGSIELTAQGRRTEDGTPVSATKTVEVSPEHIFVDGVCGCGAVKNVTVTAPFTITVKKVGNTAPRKTVFELELVDKWGEKLSFADDVTVSGTMTTTNGKGDYEGNMTFTGPSQQLRKMLGEGAFVRQVNGGKANWTYDDTVWGLWLFDGAAYATADSAGFIVLIFPTSCEKTGDGGLLYSMVDGANQVEKMTFTNTYTKYTTRPSENGTNTGTVTSPQTGDNSNLAVWFALLAVSAAGVMGAGVYSKRRRSSR